MDMGEQRTYRVVGIRKDGTRAILVSGEFRETAKAAMARVVDEHVFLAVAVELEPTSSGRVDPQTGDEFGHATHPAPNDRII